MTNALRAGLALAVVLIAVSPALAQDDTQRLRDQLRQTVLQLRQLQDSQAALQAQKAAAEQERDALRAQIAKLEGATKGAEAGRAQLQQGLAKYRDAYAQASQQAQQTEAARAQATTQLTSTNAQLQACTEKNVKLIALAREILASYEDFDIGDALGASEPFTKLKRVELENLAQGYEDGVYAGKYDPNAVPPAQPAQPAPATQPAQPAQPPAAESKPSQN